MKRNNTWRVVTIIFVLVWALYELYPPTPRPLIGEFVRRASSKDTNFTAIVTRAEALQKQSLEKQVGENNAYKNLFEAIGTNSITGYFPIFNVAAEKEPTRAILNRLQREAAGKIKLGLDLQGGTSFLVFMDSSKLLSDTNRTDKAAVKETALSHAVEVLRKRIDKFGVAEPVIQPSGEDRILIMMPGLSESENQSVRNQIEKAAFLEFRMVHPESDTLVRDGRLAPGYELLKEKRKGRDGKDVLVAYLVKRTSELGLTGKNVKRAGVNRDPITMRPEIHFTLDDEGSSKFAKITRENIGRQMAIVLDGELYSAPTIQGEIPGGSGQITGNFDLKEALELASVLENPLEAPVKIMEERRVDPSLGKDSIKSGVTAALIGTAAVVVFMLVYYMLSGAVAIVALLLNIIVMLGVMCSIDTTLTLPGIAGIVLTIGMAVDANVLIYERIREELAASKSIRGAISAGYDKAFGTIFDSNLTTLIASVLLIYLGTGPVKGFGVTLTIGVSVSMFTALIVTRVIFDWLLEKNLIQSLPMLQLIKGEKIDFMKVAKVAFIASWVLIVIGNGYGLYRGTKVLGPDFIGGDSLTIRFDQAQKAAMPIDKLRDAVSALKAGDPAIQFQKDLATGAETLRVTVAFNEGTRVFEAIKKQFTAANLTLLSLDKVGPTVGKEITKTAVMAALFAMFGILVYVAFRYEFSFAVGAVLAIIHDILMTSGWFFLTGRELSAPIVAAVLTIIGFSINDTIVIFDRIREDLKLGVRGSFKEVMNQALNQTLSRTIITSGTVFLATLSLYLFGGGVINDFAFTFLVGIVTGTYSSIYIASALVLWWHKGQRPTLSATAAPVPAQPIRA
ncbi:protein translocase subunit SecDF [Verrucomicrobiota bacterium]|nr:protein translocase subunit SecDF [Verrucomicrobiota bacterium]